MCSFVRYFCILLWDDITIIWDESIVYFFNWEKKSVLDQEEVCLLNFHQQIIVISSQNIVQKDMNKCYIYKSFFDLTCTYTKSAYIEDRLELSKELHIFVSFQKCSLMFVRNSNVALRFLCKSSHPKQTHFWKFYK